MMSVAFVDTVLVDWREMVGEDEDGNVVGVSFSSENAEYLMLNDRHTCKFVQEYGVNHRNYIIEKQKILKKK